MIEHVVITCDESNPIEARIDVRLARPAATEDDCKMTLEGTVEGPTCTASHTLPATIPLRAKGPSVTPEAVAVVPDPCFWTPELPFLYRMRLALVRDGEVVEQSEQVLGLRRRGRDGIVCDRPVPLEDVSPEDQT